MNARRRARARLNRHVPGWEHWDARQPLHRLVERSAARDMPERPVPGARLPDRSEGSTKALRPADTSHNAPLLIRLVRYPYALPTARPGRIETGTRGTAVREGLEPRTPTHELLAEARVDTAFGNPMRGLHDRPEFRPHPFARIRAARDEEGSR